MNYPNSAIESMRIRIIKAKVDDISLIDFDDAIIEGNTEKFVESIKVGNFAQIGAVIYQAVRDYVAKQVSVEDAIEALNDEKAQYVEGLREDKDLGI